MEITGKIIQAFDKVEGVSKAGNPWKKKEYVLETHDQYPRKVFFNFFGDRVDQYPLNIGDEVTVSFDIESREFNGRWYTDIRAWKAERAGQAAPAAAPQPVNDFPPSNLDPAADFLQGEKTDDLPF